MRNGGLLLFDNEEQKHYLLQKNMMEVGVTGNRNAI
jgi:hypothetical protein